MKNTPTRIIVSFLSVILLAGCSKDAPSQNPPATDNSLAKGADIIWLPQMEATGYKFYNDNSKKEDCFQILKDHGIN